MLPRVHLWWSPHREAARPGWLCQMSGGASAQLRPDLSIGVAPGLAGRQPQARAAMETLKAAWSEHGEGRQPDS